MTSQAKITILAPVGVGKSHICAIIQRALVLEYGDKFPILCPEVESESNLIGSDIANWTYPTLDSILIEEKCEPRVVKSEPQDVRFIVITPEDDQQSDRSNAIRKVVQERVVSTTGFQNPYWDPTIVFNDPAHDPQLAKLADTERLGTVLDYSLTSGAIVYAYILKEGSLTEVDQAWAFRNFCLQNVSLAPNYRVIIKLRVSGTPPKTSVATVQAILRGTNHFTESAFGIINMANPHRLTYSPFTRRKSDQV